jgi:hypothetical protein
MSDLVTAAVAYEVAQNHLDDTRATMTDARSAQRSALLELVAAASASDDPAISAAGAALTYVETEIATKIEGPDGERERRAAVKEAAAQMRAAARGGDARAEEAQLVAAEVAHGEIRGEIRDLKKARKEAEAGLLRLTRVMA